MDTSTPITANHGPNLVSCLLARKPPSRSTSGSATSSTTKPAPAAGALRSPAWVGFFRDTHTAVLCDALLEAFPGARAFEHVGVRRRGGIHSTGDFMH